jgi:hypothetical protein
MYKFDSFAHLRSVALELKMTKVAGADALIVAPADAKPLLAACGLSDSYFSPYR